jgi:hypothetical protein
MIPLPVLLLCGPAVAGAATAANPAPDSQPVLRHLTIRGAERTRDSLMRGAIPVEEGDAIGAGDLRETRRRLEDTSLFSRVDVETTAAGPDLPDTVDLDVDVEERHGFGGWAAVGGRLAIDLVKQRLTTRYVNLAGRGVTLGGFYRWERTQPQTSFELDSVRPFGLGVSVHLGGLTGRPTYDVDDDGQDISTLRTRGGDFGLRRVVGPRTTVGAGVHFRDRTWSVAGPDTESGRVSALQVGIDHRLVDRPRHRLDVALGAMSASEVWGSDLTFSRTLVRASYRGLVGAPAQDAALQRTELAAQVHWGRGGESTPLDEMFAPGAASQMELPLRAHRQKRGGVLGHAPIGRTLLLGNFEWRQRVWSGAWRGGTFQAATVLFYDVARLGDTARGMPSETVHDLGFGLRIGMGRSLILRGDFAASPSDGKTSLTVGIGHAF